MKYILLLTGSCRTFYSALFWNRQEALSETSLSRPVRHGYGLSPGSGTLRETVCLLTFMRVFFSCGLQSFCSPSHIYIRKFLQPQKYKVIKINGEYFIVVATAAVSCNKWQWNELTRSHDMKRYDGMITHDSFYFQYHIKRHISFSFFLLIIDMILCSRHCLLNFPLGWPQIHLTWRNYPKRWNINLSSGKNNNFMQDRCFVCYLTQSVMS